MAATNPEEVSLTYAIDGAVFNEINDDIKRQLRIDGGVQLSEMSEGAWQEAGIEEGFVITKVGDEDIEDLAEFQQLLDSKKRALRHGEYPNGDKEYFKIEW